MNYFILPGMLRSVHLKQILALEVVMFISMVDEEMYVKFTERN